MFRSTVAAAALSSEDNNNRNRFILDETPAIWTLDEARKVWGLHETLRLSYDGDKEDVIKRITQMEELDEERYRVMLASELFFCFEELVQGDVSWCIVWSLRCLFGCWEWCCFVIVCFLSTLDYYFSLWVLTTYGVCYCLFVGSLFSGLMPYALDPFNFCNFVFTG
ncbi:hypothetical protein RHMOL_Rhmol08G0183400 [Rhododendron molle]|uniref:Uncharacterized protein n=1 Tax=Rhododendron molle TaxID=49168 RepID=A0ACC0MQE4_RHOML|nr:hypothetical protein RHMOL_Rhmol08G0183400 [Rhododendron molle]